MSTVPGPPENFGRWVIYAVIVIGILGVLYVMAGVAGVVIPGFIVTIAWICLAVVIAVVAIRFLMKMAG